MDGSTGFTCVTCRVVFETAELQRDHYKTEWHRYNLKRQAAELPAIGFELFSEKAASFNPTMPAVAPEVEPLYCKACKKSIKSENAMTDHVASKKHKDNEKKSQEAVKKGPKQPRKKPENMPKKEESVKENENEEEDDDDSSGWETDEGEEGIEELNDDDALPVTSCLFCPQTKPTMEETRKHMSFHHGFQLPDRQYLVDELGCLNYLGLKIGAGRTCIFCPDTKGRYETIQSCQQHMRDKEHCKLRRDPQSMIELDDYYDYSPMYEGDDDEKNDSELFDDGWSLTLPSGAKIGHRQLHRYFKQYLRPVDGTQRLVSKAAIDKARGFYPALAWTGTTTVEAKKVARDMKFVERFRRRCELRRAVKSNKLFKTNGFVGDNH